MKKEYMSPELECITVRYYNILNSTVEDPQDHSINWDIDPSETYDPDDDIFW